MATSQSFVEYTCEQVAAAGAVRSKKMFGEYMVYVNDKPVLLLCNNTVYVKILPCTEALLIGAATGEPYKGAKPHYILDIDNAGLSLDVVAALEAVTPVPKPKKKK